MAYGAQPMMQRPSIGAAYGAPVGFGYQAAPTLAGPTLGAPLAAPAMTLPQTGYFNNAYSSGVYDSTQTQGVSAAHGVGVGSVGTTAKDTKVAGKTRDVK